MVSVNSSNPLPILEPKALIRFKTFFLTKGSPPVSLIFLVPRLIKDVHKASISSRDNTSFLGKKVMFSAIQYTHLKSQRSVKDTLR